MTASKLKIELWSDVMCPWCAIGYANLATALKQISGEIEAEIHWMPYELNPGIPDEGEAQDKVIARNYGRTGEQAAQMREEIRKRGDEAGINLRWQGEGPEPVAMMRNTRRAHILLAWALAAYGPDAQTRLKLALFQAHFGHHRDIARPDVLVEIATQAGLDGEQALAALTDDRLVSRVVWEEDRAAQLNITAVPTMLMNERLLVSGARTPEVYIDAMRQALNTGS